jgi:hypothetical protein
MGRSLSACWTKLRHFLSGSWGCIGEVAIAHRGRITGCVYRFVAMRKEEVASARGREGPQPGNDNLLGGRVGAGQELMMHEVFLYTHRWQAKVATS